MKLKGRDVEKCDRRRIGRVVGNVCNDIIVKVSERDNESVRDYIGGDGISNDIVLRECIVGDDLNLMKIKGCHD